MKKRVIKIVKYFKPLYNVYFLFGSIIINILKLFVKPNDNLILFISFGGKKYDDSPRVIYERMLKDSRFDGYEIYWAFHHPEKFKIPRGTKIKTDSLKYYITALKARCWITNSTVERGLKFKGKNTFYFNTWHGTPIKKMGKDISKENNSFHIDRKWDIDLMVSQSKYEADILSKLFNIGKERFLMCGLPRNDALADPSIKKVKNKMMQTLGIPLDKKVILYAPTFREYERDDKLNCVLMPPIDFNKWKREIGSEYVVLLRAHYEVSKVLNVSNEYEFLYDVSDYPVLNDLMIASDILISDYSSVIFDYSILDKPIISYTYDYEMYNKNRGLYFDVRKYFLGGSISEDELLKLIQNLPYQEAVDRVKKFRKKYVEYYGESTNQSIDYVYKEINNSFK